MTFRNGLGTRKTSRWLLVLLSFFALWLLAPTQAQAEDCVADLGGVVDGNVTPVPPSQIQIDGNCTIRNFPPSNPLTTNFSFLTQPGQTDERWLIIFDNVYHTGQMACNAVAGHKIWFTNGSSSTIQEGCQNLLIPVEKIDKKNPAGQTTAAIGVPFTYRLTIPVLFDPATENVIDFAGSPNQLHGVEVTDDLNATGVALTYLSHTAYWEGSGAPVPHSFSNAGGVLSFTGIPIVPAETQFVIEITVVLDDSPLNTIGKSFVNTAKWQFGRLIDGVFYNPLPGEWGITPPLMIAAPNLVVTKTGPATMNLGTWGQFGLDVLNDGTGDAWNLTLRDRLPDGPAGGLCDAAPEVQGVTLAGTPLSQGTHYTLAYAAAPACELTLVLLDAAGPVRPGQHLVVTYRSQLDGDTQNGASLTNVAGVTQWFNGPTGIANRQGYSRALTDGTVGTLDHQDAHTVAVSLLGFFFEKTVVNLRSGQNPATAAAPGDTLRYTLRLRSTTDALDGFSIRDELDALNGTAAFLPGSLSLVSALPPGASNNSSATGGARGTGLIDIGNLQLGANSELTLVFDATVSAATAAGTVVANQAQVISGGTPFMLSDDPYVNGVADPFLAGDEDPTRVVVGLPTLVFEKTVVSGATAQPGDVVRYRLRLQNVSDVSLSGFSMVDALDALNAGARFVPGTLALVSAVPAGATNQSNPAGGSRGTGLLDLRNLAIGVAGSPTDTLTVEFTAQLAAVIDNGSVVLNQAQLFLAGRELQKSDDPALSGTQDPTPLVIRSAPVLRVLKTSEDITGDAGVLRAGDRLRYTITIANVGNDNATDVVLRDAVPANTAYVAGSTTLNGTAVADAGGASPLASGMPVNAPQAAPGTVPADATAAASSVATVTFLVQVDASAADGTVIANQGFVSAPLDSLTDVPSDDPATPVLNDPTRDVVGQLPLLYAEKRVALQSDLQTPGVVDPGDVLRYTITVHNSGRIAATGAMLADPLPANTTYVANSLSLNGQPVGQPDGGVLPLVAGLSISSSDLTPPLPGPGQGSLSPSGSAVLQFDVRVVDGVPGGTIISNQALVRTRELPVLPTDGDGNPATGPEPTVVVVGSGQQLAISKQVAVVGGGPALAGGQLEYVVRVTNISTVPAQYVVITDDLAAPVPGRISYVDQSASLEGSAAGIGVAGSVITADYSGTYGPLPPGRSVALRFRAHIAPGLVAGTRITNTGVVTWNNPPLTARASVSIDVGGITGVGILSGKAWHDANFDGLADAAERVLAGWSVQLHRDGRLVHTALTDAAGVYQISGVAPNYVTGEPLELRFLAPGAGADTAKLGYARSEFTNDLQRIADIVVRPGSNLQNLNLPIEPNGVVYNTMTRRPIAGAALTLVNAGSRTTLPESCFLDAAQQGQITRADGYYRFDLSFADPACASGGAYLIDVTAPSTGFVAGYSEMIPPAAGPAATPFAVPSCPGTNEDAVPATAQRCEAQVSALAPGPGVRARSAGTRYVVHLRLDDSRIPGSSQIFNNHIPLDPVLDGLLSISKTTPLLNVTRGQLVPYEITLRNVGDLPLIDVGVADRFPAGFRYVPGSARLDGVAAEPVLAGRELAWRELSFAGTDQHTITLLLAVGAGVSEGEFVNRAQAINGLTGRGLSGEATATVRVTPDPTFDCTDVTGKVFDDANRNRRQEAGEAGLAGVRLVTARGLAAITDAFGRFHITCAITPMEGRGSNFVLKLDERTLPSGYRPSTPVLRVERATRGKALRINFGASIHRTVSLDLSDAVFEPGTTGMRLQWVPRMDLLLEELRKGPAVLRLTYLADVEDESLVDRRLNGVKKQIEETWKTKGAAYPLTIEPDVFWRRGAPPRPLAAPVRAAR